MLINANNRIDSSLIANEHFGGGFFIMQNVAFVVPLGAVLCTLSLLTFLGNAMVVHAIRTERKLHTVGLLQLKRTEKTENSIY